MIFRDVSLIKGKININTAPFLTLFFPPLYNFYHFFQNI
ncbi:hypothetical protein SA27298_0184 [Streptococcus anginosus]|nr:hypothetical protein SA27298_0184 [Streptococcus anginosus]